MSSAEISGWMAFYLLEEEAIERARLEAELEADALAETARAGAR